MEQINIDYSKLEISYFAKEIKCREQMLEDILQGRENASKAMSRKILKALNKQPNYFNMKAWQDEKFYLKRIELIKEWFDKKYNNNLYKHNLFFEKLAQEKQDKLKNKGKLSFWSSKNEYKESTNKKENRKEDIEYQRAIIDNKLCPYHH